MELKFSKFAISEVAKSKFPWTFSSCIGYVYSHFCLLRKMNRTFFPFQLQRLQQFLVWDIMQTRWQPPFLHTIILHNFAIQMCTMYLLTCCNDLNQWTQSKWSGSITDGVCGAHYQGEEFDRGRHIFHPFLSLNS